MKDITNEILDFCRIDADEVDSETKEELAKIVALNTIKELEAIIDDKIDIPASENCHEIEDVVMFRINQLKKQYNIE